MINDNVAECVGTVEKDCVREGCEIQCQGRFTEEGTL